MKILLLRDVFKLGQAGDVKKVADGYARNYLLPRRLAVPATDGALGMAHRAQAAGAKLREQEAKDKAGIAEQLETLSITFPVQANDEGRLFGSITHQMVADAIEAACGEKIDRRSVLSPALRQTGEHQVSIRLTADLTPSVTVIVHREDEVPSASHAQAPDSGTSADEEEAEIDAIREDEVPSAGHTQAPDSGTSADEEEAEIDAITVQQEDT